MRGHTARSSSTGYRPVNLQRVNSAQSDQYAREEAFKHPEQVSTPLVRSRTPSWDQAIEPPTRSKGRTRIRKSLRQRCCSRITWTVLLGLVSLYFVGQIRVSVGREPSGINQKIRDIVLASKGANLISVSQSDRILEENDITVWRYLTSAFDLYMFGKPATVEPTTEHTASVIFCHGITDNGYGWRFLGEELKTYMPHVRWIFPHAPKSPITANQGQIGHSWFDIAARGAEAGEWPAHEDKAGMTSSAETIEDLIKQEIRSGVPSTRIVVAGFSQGSILALLVGLTSKTPLAGTAVLAGYLPLKDQIAALANPQARARPLFWGHGVKDSTVLYKWAETSIAYLRNTLHLTQISDHAYQDLAHWVSLTEVVDLLDWLQLTLPDPSMSRHALQDTQLHV
ncbi:hypothetical protein E5Q_00485 [Mixia osmundae IAM 14324]|uniref:Acyl-protein thioesterase 1 n=1 Tax=Mixia osmundae (strain CBS 9802 / IAM 14324 / JCM 22182 / KY 12970) TaxID=764103 RepID=G7DTJ2_MIXOS|nr:hypothetical protein E5Q_00485 [Mixia osmundae IAM 14324]